jgi:hypothetical protein
LKGGCRRATIRIRSRRSPTADSPATLSDFGPGWRTSVSTRHNL